MTEPGHARQEPDLVPGQRLLLLAGAAVCVSALGVLVSWWMLSGEPASQPSQREAASIALGEGTPEQAPFETSERGLALEREQRKQLSRYGWQDRDAGMAQIPIERAIELRAEGVR